MQSVDILGKKDVNYLKFCGHTMNTKCKYLILNRFKTKFCCHTRTISSKKLFSQIYSLSIETLFLMYLHSKKTEKLNVVQ